MDSKQYNNKKLQLLEDEQLPQELQWENMEASIFLKMEELQSSLPSDNNKGHRHRILLGFLLLLLGTLLSILFLLIYKPASENTADLASSGPLPIPIEHPYVEEANKVGNAEQMPAPNIEQIIAGKSKTPQALPQYNEQQSLTAVRKDEADSHSANTLEMLETQPRDIQKSASSKTFKQSIYAKQESDVPLTMLNADKTPTIRSTNLYLLAPVDPLVDHDVMTPVVSQTSKKETALPMAALPIEPLCPTFKTRSSQVWLTGGASWWSAGYGSTKPERAEFEQAILSYQGQFSYVKPVKKDLFLLVGLQYQQLESRLNWNTQIEDFELTLEDTIIQIRRNALTGEETEIRGDVTLTVSAERQVQHFNSFSLLQVPLGIGKIWEKGRLQSHLLIGGVANLSFSRQGRTLYQAELVDYDEASSNILTDKLSFSAMLSGGLSYRISNRMDVITVVQYQHSFSNWSIEQGITMRPRMLNWSLGVNYSL